MDALRKDIHSSEIPVVCRSCEARHGGVCGALTPEQLIEFSRYTARRAVRPGGELHGQGERVHSYANVLRGVVKLTKMMPDGRQQIVGLQFAPDFIGRPFSAESALSAEAVIASSESGAGRLLRTTRAMERASDFCESAAGRSGAIGAVTGMGSPWGARALKPHSVQARQRWRSGMMNPPPRDCAHSGWRPRNSFRRH